MHWLHPVVTPAVRINAVIVSNLPIATAFRGMLVMFRIWISLGTSVKVCVLESSGPISLLKHRQAGLVNFNGYSDCVFPTQ
jgi:hypothetical protein